MYVMNRMVLNNIQAAQYYRVQTVTQKTFKLVVVCMREYREKIDKNHEL